MSMINVVISMPEIDAYIKKVHGEPRNLNPREIQVITQQSQAQLRVIRRNWPVRTGASRAAWSASVLPTMGAIKLILENTMYYSSWITKKGQRPVAKNGTPWYVPLTSQVWNANKPRLFRLLKEEIDRTERELAQASLAQTPPTLLKPQTRTQRSSSVNNLIKLVRRQEVLNERWA